MTGSLFAKTTFVSEISLLIAAVCRAGQWCRAAGLHRRWGRRASDVDRDVEVELAQPRGDRGARVRRRSFVTRRGEARRAFPIVPQGDWVRIVLLVRRGVSGGVLARYSSTAATVTGSLTQVDRPYRRSRRAIPCPVAVAGRGVSSGSAISSSRRSISWSAAGSGSASRSSRMLSTQNSTPTGSVQCSSRCWSATAQLAAGCRAAAPIPTSQGHQNHPRAAGRRTEYINDTLRITTL